MGGIKFIVIASIADSFVGKERELLNYGFNPVPVESVVPIGTVSG